MIEDLLGITGGAAADVHIRAGRFNVFFVSCFLSFSLSSVPPNLLQLSTTGAFRHRIMLTCCARR